MADHYKLLIAFLVVNIVLLCTRADICRAQDGSNDTLTIKYLDLSLAGTQVFPLKEDLVDLESLVEDSVLLCFWADDYYYCFYNPKKKLSFLSASYWNARVLQYLRQEENKSNGSKFIRADYCDGPFLTGFYSATDSILVLTADLRNGALANKKKLRVSYFSTSNETQKNGNNLLLSDISQIISSTKIQGGLEKRGQYKIVLLEATSLVTNAWYNSYPGCHSEFSNAIVLSVDDDKLTQMQYLDSEYIDHVFKRACLSTKHVHYH